ncbi:MAG TPA: P-loop NTPase [Mycobacteriales bacterium]|nr:P-loop NTPase [Mycobacteriales bacterium]
MLVIVNPDPAGAETLRSSVAPDAEILATVDVARRHLTENLDVDVAVIGSAVELEPALALAEAMRVTRPELGVILVRRRVDTTVLTEALRAGMREVVAERDMAALGAAVRRARDIARAMRAQGNVSPVGDEDHRPLGRVITVFSAKGGCGKTTISTNLAAAIADGGRRSVCVLDLDLAFGDVAIALQLFPAHTLADAVPIADTLDLTAVEQLLTPHSPGLTTLVAPVEPGAADIPTPVVVTVLRILREMFQYVVVDTPPAFTDHVLAAFDESDVLALLATMDIPALKNLKLSLETLDLLNYPRDKWRIVLNRADAKVGLAMSEVEKTLRVPISAEVPSSRDVPASVNRGVPIVLESPSHPVSQAIKQFAERHVVSATPASASIPKPLRDDRRAGLLRRRAKHS